MMNKDWVGWQRGTPEYQEALTQFIDMVNEKLGNPKVLSCPCVDCKNLDVPLPADEVYVHLLLRGMDPTYTKWIFHGEPATNLNGHHQEESTPNVYQMYVDAIVEDDVLIDQLHETEYDEGLAKLVEDADTPLYLGCKTHTKLSITIELYKIKTVNGLSRKAFDELLKTNGSMLPPGNCLTRTTYEVKKLLKAFQLTYMKIHACVNDCCLFIKELADADEYPKCHYSRWKEDKSNLDADVTDKPQKKVPVKVLRYFPLVLRLKRMFKSEMSEHVNWHATQKSQDGKLRHPSDSLAWKHIDKKWPEFASDSRNLRFGLAADGFNPFGELSSTHSCWPVMLVVYNLPPSMCMQIENIMLSLLIPGKKQPGNDIDVYLQPLIDELKELWDMGVQVYDSFSQTTFNLKEILMWTINDFPAYGNLSGCTYKGKAACPICGEHTLSNWLSFSHKTVYMNHRRFLPFNHPLRNKKCWFNGEIESKEKPPVMSGAEVFERQSTVVNDFGKAKQNEEEKRREKQMKKKNKKINTKNKRKTTVNPDVGQSNAAAGANDGNTGLRKRKRLVATDAGQRTVGVVAGADNGNTALRLWTKRSIFFEAPYWKDLLLRHNIDVMHTEKNVCESLIGNILNIKNKSKDGLKSRNDLKSMGIRPELHPQEKNGKTRLPPAPYTLSDKEKTIFYNRLRNLKVPDGYSSDLRRHFLKDDSLSALKAHDYHVLMQQILPVALKGLLPVGPRDAIFRLCSYFNEICQRVVDLDRIVELEEEVAETLCMLERYFPPSFFDVMVHLTIHLAREVRLCGPVQYRWMYPFERYMKTFKEYVQNYALPEACIAECYLGMECVRFFDNHVDRAAEIGVKQRRNEDIQNGFAEAGHPLSGGVHVRMSREKLKTAHIYVLFNTAEVDPYIIMHMDELKSSNRRFLTDEDQLLSTHSDTFVDWFRQKVILQIHRGTSVTKTLEWLSSEPLEICMSYKGLVINGTRFLTQDVQRVTQNSGVSIESKSLIAGQSNSTIFYGVLRNIFVLDYHMFQIPLFECDWANSNLGVKVEDGFKLVNLLQYKNQFENDPFILASQARQVFYSRESDSSKWYVVLKPPPRGFHELKEYDEKEDTGCQPLDTSTLGEAMDDESESYARRDAEEILVPKSKKNKKKKKKHMT